MNDELNLEDLEQVTAGLDKKGFEDKKEQITNEYHKEQLEELKKMKEELEQKTNYQGKTR